MATSNSEWLGRVLNCLKEGLGPYTLEKYRAKFPYLNGQDGGTNFSDYITAIHQTLAPEWQGMPLHEMKTDAQLLGAVDAYGWLILIGHQERQSLFSENLTPIEINYTHELRECRNKWVYQQPVSHDDTQRAADSAERLLRKIGAWEQAQQCADIRDAVKRDDLSVNLSWGILSTLPSMDDDLDAAGATQRLLLKPEYWISIQLPAEPPSGYRLEHDRTIIGRNPMNCDLVVNDTLVSRVHLQVVQLKEGGLAIMDLHSANGTLLDGQSLRPNIASLWSSDQVVTIGKSELRLLSRFDAPQPAEQDTGFYLTLNAAAESYQSSA